MKLIPLIARLQPILRSLAVVGQSAMLLLLRLIYGGQYIETGHGKLTHLDNITQFFASLHILAPGFNAVLVGCTEFFGGICLVLGLGTRFATVPLTVSMIVAYLTDERATAFKSLDNFTAAAPYQFLLACLVIMAFGPGRVAVDAWFAARLKKRLATQSSR
jgi:putative oxidoreductase